MKKQIKALTLISGGLDSILAALLIKNQGIKVTGLGFKSLFFNAKNAKKLAKNAKIPLKTIDISQKHLEIVKNPPHGYGKNANPCIDCHLLMLKEAKKVMKEQKCDFIVTGEVLGQRPFSQNKNSLNLLEKESCLKDLILRPLSAKLLPPTLPEQKGWVDRKKLLAIQGRSRKSQLALAKKFKLKNYSTPGVSCILTDPQFSQRLFNLLEVCPKCTSDDVQLLRLGRHFWQNKTLIIIGRHHQENLKLKRVTQKNDFILEPQFFPGPTILVRSYGKLSKNKTLEKAKQLLKKYSPKAPEKIKKEDFSVILI